MLVVFAGRGRVSWCNATGTQGISEEFIEEYLGQAGIEDGWMQKYRLLDATQELSRGVCAAPALALSRRGGHGCVSRTVRAWAARTAW